MSLFDFFKPKPKRNLQDEVHEALATLLIGDAATKEEKEALKEFIKNDPLVSVWNPDRTLSVSIRKEKLDEFLATHPGWKRSFM